MRLLVSRWKLRNLFLICGYKINQGHGSGDNLTDISPWASWMMALCSFYRNNTFVSIIDTFNWKCIKPLACIWKYDRNCWKVVNNQVILPYIKRYILESKVYKVTRNGYPFGSSHFENIHVESSRFINAFRTLKSWSDLSGWHFLENFCTLGSILKLRLLNKLNPIHIFQI